MNPDLIPHDHLYERDLERMSPAGRLARERGERQWRREVSYLDGENRLPLANPGSIPNWEHLLRTRQADSGDIQRYYKNTHHEGVVIDDDELESLTLSDLVTLSQGTVTFALLRSTRRSLQRKKQFVKAMLKVLDIKSFV